MGIYILKRERKECGNDGLNFVGRSTLCGFISMFCEVGRLRSLSVDCEDVIDVVFDSTRTFGVLWGRDCGGDACMNGGKVRPGKFRLYWYISLGIEISHVILIRAPLPI